MCNTASADLRVLGCVHAPETVGFLPAASKAPLHTGVLCCRAQSCNAYVAARMALPPCNSTTAC